MGAMGEAEQRQPDAKKKASAGQVAKAVFWSFFGVRKASDLQKDVEQLNPVHVIVAGVIGAMLLVAGLLALVSWVLSSGVAK